jgi:hypothetical protein
MRSFGTLFRKLRTYPWLALLIVTVLLWLYPQGYRCLRAAFLVCLLGLWLGGAFLLRRHRAFAAAVLGLGLIPFLFLSLPGKTPNAERLRDLYVDSLRHYEGSPYVWGGENRLGIDCSGLVRKGLIDAHVRLGLATFNPQPIRTAFTLWWHDCSARALGDGYRDLTRPLFDSASINAVGNSLIAPGDIAVTTGGAHVLAYLGDRTWIEADPHPMKVITVTTPSRNPWFNMPVHVLRWSALTESPDRTTGGQPGSSTKGERGS